MPHPVKGESIYAYVSVLDDVGQPSAKLHAELVNLVKTQIGSFAAPDVIHWAPGARQRVWVEVFLCGEGGAVSTTVVFEGIVSPCVDVRLAHVHGCFGIFTS